MSNTPGYGGQTGSKLEFEILASDQYELKSITIDTSTRDAGNTTTTDLRRGLLLAPSSALGGMYTTFDAASKDPDLSDDSKIVVLAENVFGIDDGDQVAVAFWKATFRPDTLIDTEAGGAGAWTPADCQRILVANE